MQWKEQVVMNHGDTKTELIQQPAKTRRLTRQDNPVITTSSTIHQSRQTTDEESLATDVVN